MHLGARIESEEMIHRRRELIRVDRCLGRMSVTLSMILAVFGIGRPNKPSPPARSTERRVRARAA